ncbi:MAG: MBL fold metallo-hydrolase [Gemmatimonadaceae bacterium]
MLLRRIFDDKLAQASYLVACEHARVAMVVDPNRNIAQYIDAASRDNVRITHVTETHIHADFISGSRDLANATGAQLLLSDAGPNDWKYAFAHDANAELLTDGSSFLVGDVRVEVVHTPGHTPEHITFLLTDTATAQVPMGAITGDFIFVGDVGRPDLLERAAGQSGTMKAGARQLFRSIQAFKTYPDYLQLWPGHGAGSACGKALGAMPQSTLGYEKIFNWALAETDEAAFVQKVLAGQPEPPAYFATMKRLNRDGPPRPPTSIPKIAAVMEVAKALNEGAIVVDTRLISAFTAVHSRGTTSIPRNKSFLTWSGALLPYDRPAFFIGASDVASRRSLALDLSLIGIDSIAGVLPAEALDDLIAVTGAAQIADAAQETAESMRNATTIDVRSRAEYDHGHIPFALNIPLTELQSRLDEVPNGNILVQCQGGSRSVIAASILQREGRSGVMNLPGGFAEWERAGHPVERGLKTTGV